MTQRQISQSGSIAAFLMVGIVLAGLVIGGSYLVHQRGEIARAGEPTPSPVAVHQENTSANNGASSDEQQKTKAAEQEAADKKAAEQKAADQAAADKKAAEQKAAEQKAQQEAAAAAPTAVATVPQTGRESAPQTAEQLPVTGPADTFIRVVAGSILIGGVIAYLRSYRYRFGSLFR